MINSLTSDNQKLKSEILDLDDLLKKRKVDYQTDLT